MSAPKHDFSWEGEESNGVRLRATNLKKGVGGLDVWLQRRTLIAQPKQDETVSYEQRWFLVAELALYAPLSFAEIARAVAHWVAFYDDRLSASALVLAGDFAKWVGEPHEPQSPQTPQGLAN